MLAGRMMDQPLLIIDILRHAAQAFPVSQVVSRTVEGQIHRYGYEDAYRRTAQLAHALEHLGIREGDRVATVAWNTYRHFELYYGVSGIGAVCHTINPRLFVNQLEYVVNHADDRAMFIDLNLVPLIEKMADRFGKVRHYVIMTDREHMPRTSLRDALCYEELLEGMAQTYDWPQFDENAAAAMCYTSGTTGNPKGSLYSHRSTVLHALGVLAPGILPYDRNAVVMPVVPMFHVQAWGQPYAAPICGARLVLPGANLDGKSLHELMETEAVTMAFGGTDNLAGTARIPASVRAKTVIRHQSPVGRFSRSRCDDQGLRRRIRHQCHAGMGHDGNQPGLCMWLRRNRPRCRQRR